MTHYYPSRPGYRPTHYNYWVCNRRDPSYCRRSVYFHFGLPYVQVGRVHVRPYISLGYRSGPIVISGTYYLDRTTTSALDDALSDIRGAWLDGRPDLIERHVRSSGSIAVLLDGRYDYSIDSDDYIQMTSDAMDQMDTIGFTWESTRERSDGTYTVFGKHTYRDSDGITKVVYVSYTLRRIGSSYYIEEVGSSLSRLE